MAKKDLLILTVHGMGETEVGYWKGLERSLRKAIKPALWDRILFRPIYYQNVVQVDQSDVWANMLAEHKLDWQALRKLMLFAFSDAATLEAQSDAPRSPYLDAQHVIRGTIRSAMEEIGSVPVAIIAQSLGCQVISNYIWDSQKDTGIWKHEPLSEASAREKRFLQLKTIRLLLTTGCNIPFFVSGLKKIVPIARPTRTFEWHNYFDKDDVMGWPLRPLSPGYKRIVTRDVEINSGGMFTAWNPLSHFGYWTDKDFVRPAAVMLSALLAGNE